MHSESPERTESLFDVTPARRRAYLATFILFSLVGYGVVIWRHVSDGVGVVGSGAAAFAATPAAIAESVMLGLAIAHAAALGLALTTAEITGGTMVIADWLRTKLVEPLQDSLREEGRKEGREESNSNWREWNRRRREAEERGEPFNEPEPYQGEE